MGSCLLETIPLIPLNALINPVLSDATTLSGEWIQPCPKGCVTGGAGHVQGNMGSPVPERRGINRSASEELEPPSAPLVLSGASKMAVPLLSLAVVLLWALCAEADVAVQPDFDLEKFSGVWHIMAGASNCPVFQNMKDTMTTSAAIINPLPNGDMKFLTGYPHLEECKKIKMHFKKTDQPGRFTSDENAKQDLRVMETDYTSFAFLYIWKQAEGEPSSTTVQLLTRAPDVTPETLEKFKAHYRSVGLTDDLGVMLPKSDLCFKALSG